MESDEDPFRVLRLLESPHGCKPRIEVTDVGFQSVRGGGDAWIEEVREGKAAGFLEAQEDVVMDGAQTEDICLDDSLQVLPAQQECCRCGMEQEVTVAVEDAFLSVAWMMAESLELQSGFEVSQQVHMAALHGDAVGLKHLREPW